MFSSLIVFPYEIQISERDEGDGGNANKVKMDKEAAYSKTTRLKPDVLDQASNMNMNLDIKEDVDLME